MKVCLALFGIISVIIIEICSSEAAAILDKGATYPPLCHFKLCPPNLRRPELVLNEDSEENENQTISSKKYQENEDGSNLEIASNSGYSDDVNTVDEDEELDNTLCVFKLCSIEKITIKPADTDLLD